MLRVFITHLPRYLGTDSYRMGHPRLHPPMDPLNSRGNFLAIDSGMAIDLMVCSQVLQ